MCMLKHRWLNNAYSVCMYCITIYMWYYVTVIIYMYIMYMYILVCDAVVVCRFGNKADCRQCSLNTVT